MSSIKRITRGTAAAVLVFSSLLTSGFVGVAHAGVGSDTCTWTGASSNNFSSTGNWDGCSGGIPGGGDNLVFDNTGLTADRTVTNDIPNLQVGNITFAGTGTYNFTIAGSTITVLSKIDADLLTPNISADVTLGGDVTLSSEVNPGLSGGYLLLSHPGDDATLDLNGHNLTISGSVMLQHIVGHGNITIASNAAVMFDNSQDNSTSSDWTGTLALSGGSSLMAWDNTLGAAAISVASGSNLRLCRYNGGTVSNALVVAGRGLNYLADTYSGAIVLSLSCGSGGGDSTFNSQASIVWAGPVTLTGNATVGGQGQFKVTGALSGNYTLTMEPGNSGNVSVASSDNQSGSSNGTQSSQTATTSYVDNSPTAPLSIGVNSVGVVDGTYSYTTVASGGTIKGTGTVKSLDVHSDGIVAPGHSPGKLTVQQTLSLAGSAVYQAELKNTTAGNYDQLVVGDPSQTDNNNPAVTLGDETGLPKLSVSLYTGYSINVGDNFTIVDNRSKTAIKGTFEGLPEGGTLTAGNKTFKISYKGGDGNDVVLTAVTATNLAPRAAPDTGFALVATHPLASLTVTVIAALLILGVARKNSPKHISRHLN